MMQKLYDSKNVSVKEICEQFGISATTFYRHIK